MNLTRMFNTEFHAVLSAAFTIGFFSLIAKLLGVVRNRIFAGEFGAGDIMDMYFAAFAVPDLLYHLLIVGLLGSVFIPVFAEYHERDPQEAWKLANAALAMFVGVLALAALVALLFAPQLTSIVAPGFDAAKQQSTAALMRIMLLSPILLGISSIAGSILQVHRRFFSFALAPVLYNVGIIIAAVFLVKPFGIVGLGLGVALGALLHLLVQLPPLFSLGFQFQPRFRFLHPGLKKLVRLSLPRTVGLFAQQLNTVVITALASTAAAGSIAVFHFANDLQFVPIGIVAFSFVSAVFPFLASSYAQHDMRGFLDKLYLTTNQILFLVIPVSVFLILERAQIVRVLLGYGEFSWEDTRLTAAALGAFALSIFAQSLVPLFTRAFYAVQNIKTPVFINVCSLLLNIGLSVYFLHLMRSQGAFAHATGSLFKVSDIGDISVLALPLAFSLSSLVNCLWLYVALARRIELFDSSRIIHSLLKINIASFGMALAVYGALYLVASLVNMQTFLGILTQGVVAFLVGLAAYCLFSFLFKIPEFFSFVQAFPLPLRRVFASYIPFQVNGSEKL